MANTLIAATAVLLAVGAGVWAQDPNAPWEPIPCVPADLPPERLFDVADAVDGFEAEGPAWETVLGPQNAANTIERDTAERHGGAASLRVDYRFEGREGYYEYVQVTTDLQFPEPGYGLGFWIKDDGTPFPLRLRVADAGGETHQTDMIAGPEPGWRFVATPLDTRTNSWGGDGNRRLDYPCRLVGICIDRPRLDYVGEGSLWLDDVALLKPRKLETTLQVETQGKRFGNVYDAGESVALRMRGEGDRIRWEVSDFRGNTVGAGEGDAAGTEARFTLDRPGYYACRIDLVGGGGPLETQYFRAAALPGGDETPGPGFVGANCHFGQNAYPLECLDLLVRYGVMRFRDEMSWRSVESGKGQYALPSHGEAYIRRVAELGLQPLLLFDYNNPHYDDDGFPNSEEAIAGFASYATALARLTSGVVGEFEVWNEWIGGCGMGGRPGDHGPEAYGRLLAPTYQAVKTTFPGVTVIGIGGEYGPECCENVARAIDTAGPASMDGFSIHPYRYPRTPESSDLVGEVRKILTCATDRGAAAKTWITEIGYPTHRGPGGSDEQAQARLCVRTLVLLQLADGVERVYWYDLKDDGTRREYNEHNFGLVRHQAYNCAPKPGMVAVSTFVRQTAGARAVELQRADDAYVAVYDRPDGTRTLVAWVTGVERRVRVSGRLGAAIDLMGSPIALDGPVVLSEDPIYLRGDGLELALDG